MISNLVYSVPKVPKCQTPKPSYVLSESGYDKLQMALKRIFNASDPPTDTQVATHTGYYRGTIAKIRNRNNGVNFKTLEDLFQSLKIDLVYGDYQEFNRLRKESDQKRSGTLPKKNDPIPNQTESEILTKALWELDYSNQRNLFDKAISHVKPAAAFLIHGEPNYGQRWLVNLLRCRIPYHNTNAWQKSIYIKPHRKDIDVLWQSLAQELRTSPLPQAVAEELYQHWQTRTVILAIHDVDLIAGSCLNQFMNELWQPLVERVNNAPPLQRPYRLLLFLVDNQNSKSNLETCLSLVAEPDRTQPHIPLALQELKPFDRDLIETWTGVQSQLLSQLWESSPSSAPIEQVMCEIVERNNQPISVLGDICQCFEIEWYEIERGLTL